MPMYAIGFCVDSRHGDAVIEDDALTLTVDAHWATFQDEHGLVMAIPISQLSYIKRIDDQPEE